MTRVDAQALFPVAEYSGLYKTGFGGSLGLEYPLLPYLSPFVRAGGSYSPLQASGGLVFAQGLAGLAFSYRPADRLELRLEAGGGLASVSSSNEAVGSGLAYAASGRLGAGLRVHPAVTLYASGGVDACLGSAEPFYLAGSAGLSASFRLGGFRTDKVKVRIDSVKAEAIFPVFYSYYDEHPFGSIRIRNGEDTAIEDIRVSFVVGRYMDRPKACASIASLPKGGSVEAPLTALFNDGVLALTEGSTVEGEIAVEYSQLGAGRRISVPVEMRLHHRNAMNWLDDRRAAAFASPKDPASLWFSRFVSGIVRERLRGDVDRNLQYAIGLFEAERLFGINYVVDPASSYVEKSSNEATVDYLQFPHQTLFYRGGDCDDLSILYTSLLQSMGIETAFITIPGHIYMAFALESEAAKALAEFYDPGLLISYEGKAWAPVEITMVKEGFVKAWRVGAKEWYDNYKTGSAAIYPLAEAWRLYPSVGVPDVNPRLVLPDEVAVAQAFDMSLDRYVAREIETKVADLKARTRLLPPAEAANELGVLYGRYGMMKESWRELTASAKGGYAPAWTNLANVAFLRKDYKLSLQYYEYARKIDPADPVPLLGIARSYYELERFSESDKAYAQLRAMAPELAAKYGYLASMLGGEGRAWSLSERMATATWTGTADSAARLGSVSRIAPDQAQLASLAAAEDEAAAKEAAALEAARKEAEARQAAALEASRKEAAAREAAALEASRKEAAAREAAAMEAARKEAAAREAAALEASRKEAAAREAAVLEAARKAAAEREAAALEEADREAARMEAAELEAAALEASRKEAAEREAVALEASRKEAAEREAAAREASRKEAAEREAAALEASRKEAAAREAAALEAARRETAARDAAAREAAAKKAAPPAIIEDLPDDLELAAKATGSKTAAATKTDFVPPPSAVLAAAQTPPPPPKVESPPPPPEPPAAEPSPAHVEESPNAPLAVAAAPAPAETPVAAAEPSPPPAEPAAPAPEPAAVSPTVAEASAAPVEAAVSAEAVPAETPAALVAESPNVSEAPAEAAAPFEPEPPLAAPAEAPAEVAAATAPEIAAEPLAVAAAPEPAPAVVEATAGPEPAAAAIAANEPAPTPEPPVAAADQAPLGTSDIPAEPELATIVSGFARLKPVSGQWKIREGSASQTDPKQYYAKLYMSVGQGPKPVAYVFKAKSTGSGWVGLGIHIYARDAAKLQGYGLGKSILVWLTSDPAKRGDAKTRVQLYRSLTDTWMDPWFSEAEIPESVFDEHEYRVRVEPASGELVFSVDGNERLRVSDLKDFTNGAAIALRALDMAEFSDFRVEAAR